jgi:hypothetical protein
MSTLLWIIFPALWMIGAIVASIARAHARHATAH